MSQQELPYPRKADEWEQLTPEQRQEIIARREWQTFLTACKREQERRAARRGMDYSQLPALQVEIDLTSPAGDRMVAQATLTYGGEIVCTFDEKTPRYEVDAICRKHLERFQRRPPR